MVAGNPISPQIPPLETVDTPDPPVVRLSHSSGAVSTGASIGELPTRLKELGGRTTVRTSGLTPYPKAKDGTQPMHTQTTGQTP